MALTTQGKGAFRRFKDQLHKEHPGLLPAWYAFRDARLRGNALCRISQAASAETPASSAAAHIYATSAIWLLGVVLASYTWSDEAMRWDALTLDELLGSVMNSRAIGVLLEAQFHGGADEDNAEHR